jgi:hypothetical protein
VGGAGAYIIKPFFQNNPAFFTKVVQNTVWPPPGSPLMMPTIWQTSSIIQQQHDFCWDLKAAPLVWLGYATDSGLGVRARWWQFDQSVCTSAVNDGVSTITSAAPGGIDIVSQPHWPIFFAAGGNKFVWRDAATAGETMYLKSNLKLDVWDFEATQEAEAGRWWFLFSGGFRYAHLAQNYDASVVTQGLGSGIEALRTGHNFNGAGPTLALEARRPLGNSRFALYGNVRGALLFGEGTHRVYLLETSHWPFGPDSFSSSQAKANRDTFLPVAEMELGAEYSPTLAWIHPFIRTGLVAQSWFGAGSASSDSGNLGFLGLEVSAGLNY